MWRFGIAIALLLLLIVMVADLLFDRTEASGFMQRLSSSASWYSSEPEEALYANRSTLVDSRVSGLPRSAREFVEPGAHWTDDVRKLLSAADPAVRGGRTAWAYDHPDDALARLDSLWPGGYPLADPDVAEPGDGQGGRAKLTSPEPVSSSGGMAPGTLPAGSGKTSPAASNRQIADAQRKLAALGYDPGPPDGRAGARTQTAVRAFQRDARVTADGRVDVTLIGHLDAETRIRSNMRQQELEAMAPAPVAKADSRQKRGVFGTVLGSFQRIIGRDFNSVQRPSEITAYCRGNVDTWIYDFGREAFVYCGNVITGAVVDQTASAAGDRASNR